MELLNLFGLFLDIVGAFVILSAVLVSKEEALKAGRAKYASGEDDKDLELAPVVNLLRQSKQAYWGFWVLAAGFGLQVAASWPTN